MNKHKPRLSRHPDSGQTPLSLVLLAPPPRQLFKRGYLKGHGSQLQN